MGCYLSKPNTEKEIENIDGKYLNKHLRVGTCSMQGWRNHQEDAHNAILDFMPNISLFGVYDGHGGAEVAQWVAKNLPEIIKKEIGEEKAEHGHDIIDHKFTGQIQDIFIKTDDMVRSDSVIKELFDLAEKPMPGQVIDRDEARDELDDLNEEAEMTHEELLKKYNINATEYNQQKDEIAQVFLSELVKMQQAEMSESESEEEEAKEGDEINKKRLERLEKREKQKAAIEASSTGNDIIEDNSDDSSSESETEEEPNQRPKLSDALSQDDFCGRDSGCTAILALYQRTRKQIMAANIGDSRCVVSRSGLAIGLSEDHKPEDAIELKRIVNAGGFLTNDGRVKGGLNLSRAFGDHQYKTNDKLELKDQMISAFPDMKCHDVRDEDEFMILACDGIWNVMTNQEAVDFVRDRLDSDVKISDILSEMFDHCLAPDTSGDGVGCDNMTGIIVQLNPRSKTSKRPRSDGESDEEDDQSKKSKND